MSESPVISYESDDGSSDSFRIDNIGITLVHTSGLTVVRQELLKWDEVRAVYAWITTGDGNWGFDEFYHIKLHYKDGRKLYASDLASHQFKLLYALWENLTHFLPTISENWKEKVRADYQRRIQSAGLSSWFLGIWYPNKPLIYQA